MGIFTCEQCGSCCKAVRCSLLTKENKCSTYINRPVICRVQDLYYKVRPLMPLNSWYELNKKCCSVLQSKYFKE